MTSKREEDKSKMTSQFDDYKEKENKPECAFDERVEFEPLIQFIFS